MAAFIISSDFNIPAEIASGIFEKHRKGSVHGTAFRRRQQKLEYSDVGIISTTKAGLLEKVHQNRQPPTNLRIKLSIVQNFR